MTNSNSQFLKPIFNISIFHASNTTYYLIHRIITESCLLGTFLLKYFMQIQYQKSALLYTPASIGNNSKLWNVTL